MFPVWGSPNYNRFYLLCAETYKYRYKYWFYVQLLSVSSRRLIPFDLAVYVIGNRYVVCTICDLFNVHTR